MPLQAKLDDEWSLPSKMLTRVTETQAALKQTGGLLLAGILCSYVTAALLMLQIRLAQVQTAVRHMAGLPVQPIVIF